MYDVWPTRVTTAKSHLLLWRARRCSVVCDIYGSVSFQVLCFNDVTQTKYDNISILV